MAVDIAESSNQSHTDDCEPEEEEDAPRTIDQDDVDADPMSMDSSDWRYPLLLFLSRPGCPSPINVRKVIHNYCLLDGVLSRRSSDENILLRCLGKRESRKAMGEVH